MYRIGRAPTEMASRLQGGGWLVRNQSDNRSSRHLPLFMRNRTSGQFRPRQRREHYQIAASSQPIAAF